MKASTSCGFDSGNYVFTIPSGHQGRVKVDNGVLLDASQSQDKQAEVSSRASLISSGDHNVVLEQHETHGLASAHLVWSSLK